MLEKPMADVLNEVREKLTLLWERLAEARGFGFLYGRILASLYLSEKPLSQRELSEKTQFSVPAISKTLGHLVTLGAVRKFKKKGDRTYYYSALANPREMFFAGLGKWIDDQKIMRRELSALEAKLRSSPLSEDEKKDAEKLLAILEDFEKAFDEAEKVFVELKERLMKT
jgi:DNA-binding transcriptional regulator GbsR (MarR family)